MRVCSSELHIAGCPYGAGRLISKSGVRMQFVQFIYPFIICPFIYPFIIYPYYLSIYISIYHLSIHLSIYRMQFVHLFIHYHLPIYVYEGVHIAHSFFSGYAHEHDVT